MLPLNVSQVTLFFGVMFHRMSAHIQMVKYYVAAKEKKPHTCLFNPCLNYEHHWKMVQCDLNEIQV